MRKRRNPPKPTDRDTLEVLTIQELIRRLEFGSFEPWAGWTSVLVVPPNKKSRDYWRRYHDLSLHMMSPYCSIRKYSSLAIAASPKGVTVRRFKQFIADSNDCLPDFAKQFPDRLVAVMDQGERAVAVVYELGELSDMICRDYFDPFYTYVRLDILSERLLLDSVLFSIPEFQWYPLVATRLRVRNAGGIA
jgi:hypothetical protein